jgi:hypothetical protein
VTCQILPTGFPGHQNYCPYTTGIKDGIWHGPDMAKARQLAKESRTTNVPVTVWSMWDKPVGTYLVQLLRQLGYRHLSRPAAQAAGITGKPAHSVCRPVLPYGRQLPQQDPDGRA